jgi:ECF sigma factor
MAAEDSPDNSALLPAWGRAKSPSVATGTRRILRESTCSISRLQRPSSRNSTHATSQIAELRFFGALSLDETGEVLRISIAAVKREWQAAQAATYSRLEGPRDDA